MAYSLRRQGIRQWTRRALSAAALALIFSYAAAAQVPLSHVDRSTTVSNVSFKFVDDNPFSESVLKEQLFHKEPGFWDAVARILPFISPPDFPFSPVELQKDVVRLEHYYRRNGFLHPAIDYPASQLDTTRNKIHIIFSVRHGPPLIIQDIGFFSGDDTYTVDAFEGNMRSDWMEFRDDLSLETGRRYTEFEGIRIQDQVLTWLQNKGFAFAKVDRESIVDTTANTVDLQFLVDPGPRGYVSEIQIEGNESVSDQVVLRELPFAVGDRYAARDVSEGQRELFELNLFRVAIGEVPDQPEDSTVIVRYRLSEAQPRHVTAQTGYGLEQGALVQGSWTHRNFLGGARQFTAATTFSSGYGAANRGGFQAEQEKSASLTLTQPYLFSRKLSGIISPSYVRGEVPGLNIKFEEAEVNTSLLYTVYNFRTITFNHTISRANPLDGDSFQFTDLDEADTGPLDVFNQNVFSLSANLGNVDDFLQPTSGFIIRPRVEMGGILVQLPDDVDYFKAQTEIVGYLPINDRYNLSGRIFAGHIWPRGESVNQGDPQIEYRFDRIRFYAGGGNDVRGWPSNLLGPKLAVTRAAGSFNEQLGDSIQVRLEPWGGLAKLVANVELRTPMPFMGEQWKGAVFVDMGQVFPSDTEEDTFRIRDIKPADFQVGTGVGIRYETLVGYLRVDLGYKINPNIQDLASPEEVYLIQQDIISEDDVNTSFFDRFRFHLSIGQSF